MQVNQKISKTTHLKELNTEIEKLKQELFATREKNGVYLPIKQYEAECEERRQLAARYGVAQWASPRPGYGNGW